MAWLAGSAFGPRVRWGFSYEQIPGAPRFWVFTTPSMRRSNALGLAIALCGGTPPELPLNLKSLVGRTLRAQTTTNPSGFPALVAVKPTDRASTYEYRMQTKKAQTAKNQEATE